jgi:hypothetical protein
MESIDITNPDFSLENIPNINEIISDNIDINADNSYNYVYIAVSIAVSFLCFVFYKLYINKRKQVSFLDSSTENNCYDGICCPV